MPDVISILVISFAVITAASFYQTRFACAVCLASLSPLVAKLHTQAHHLKCNSGLYGRVGRSLVLQSTLDSPVARAPQTHNTLLYHERICKAEWF